MARGKLGEISEKVQEALVDMLQERSLQKITVTSLCRAAHIHRSTFYTHYENIDQVLAEIEDEYMRHITFLDCHASEAEMMEQVLQFVYYAQSHAAMLLALSKAHCLTVPFLDQSRKTAHVVNRNKEHPMAEMRENLLSVYTVTGTMALIEEWLFYSPWYSSEEIARMIVRLSRGAAAVLDG